ncbi:MAG: transcriptional regulator [Pseudomonadota bacterium]|jgi:phosphate transport system protein
MDKHLSSQFDADLNDICTKLLEMGGLVENQLSTSLQALQSFDLSLADSVFAYEQQLNQLELEVDGECNNIIVRRQPTAKDLRLIMAISKTTTNLERAGDEAVKISKLIKRILENSNAQIINFAELKVAGQLALGSLRRALDAFARLDVNAAIQIMQEDRAIDDEFRAFVRKLVTYMMEDPRIISSGLDFLFIGKAIERIGDHAKNIAEFVIYIVKGKDVRHQTMENKQKHALN